MSPSFPRYGHSGSPFEGDSHTILARAGEAPESKAPYPYHSFPPTLRHPFQVGGPREEYPDPTADEGDGNRESTGRGSTSGDSWNSWSNKSPSERGRIMGDRQAHPAKIRGNLVPEQRAIRRSTGSLTIRQIVERLGVVIVYSQRSAGGSGGGGRRGTLETDGIF